jgi:hypothetical protein
MDKKAVYDAIASHAIAFPTKPDGSAWTNAERVQDIMQIKAEVDAAIEKIESVARDPAAEQAAIDRAAAVDAWLRDLANTDPDDFERVRFLTFEEQARLAGV